MLDKIPEEDLALTKHLLSLFKIEGKNAVEMASEGQLEIFYNIVFRPHKRLQILCSTQYGKSLFVALACIVVACVQHEMICIVAPTDEKAKIIVRYFIEHLGDSPIFESELEKESKLDRLRMEESKDRIKMKNGGGIFIISCQASNSKKGVEAAMGAGAKIVIQDESGLIPDTIESTIFRMIAGKGEDAFYCKIGNPFYRNHFHTSWLDPLYHKVFIDYQRGLAEGRYNEAFIAEARKKPLFDILYGCIFPGEESFDATGYLTLIPETKIFVSPYIQALPFMSGRIMGVDPSGEGKDDATICIRDRFRGEISYKVKTSNARIIAEVILTLMKEHNIAPNDVVVDAFGVGADVGKEVALATKGEVEIYTVLLGNTPKDEESYNGRFFRRREEEVENHTEAREKWDDLFLNLRALMYWRAKDWIFKGGRIVDEPVDNGPFKKELCVIKYKRSINGNKIQLMSKKEMRTLGIPSPNKADAFALTFLREFDTITQTKEELEKIAREENEIDDPFSIF